MQSKKEHMSAEKTYATVVGLERGFFTTLFFCFFFGGLEIPEDPALEDPVAACFRSGPCVPTARGGTSSTWPPESADVEGSGYENAIGQGSYTSITSQSSSSDQSRREARVLPVAGTEPTSGIGM